MSDGLLRVSEATALEVADLEAEGANTLAIHRSKTDPKGAGAVQYIGGPTDACPATRYGSEGRSRWPPPGPRSSRCRPPTVRIMVLPSVGLGSYPPISVAPTGVTFAASLLVGELVARGGLAPEDNA